MTRLFAYVFQQTDRLVAEFFGETLCFRLQVRQQGVALLIDDLDEGLLACFEFLGQAAVSGFQAVQQFPGAGVHIFDHGAGFALQPFDQVSWL